MKANDLKHLAAIASVAGMITSAPIVLAQDASSTSTVSPAAVGDGSTAALAPAAATTVPLPYGVSQILQLAQAKVGDDTIVAYIRNSGNSYGLSADQIIYLQKQGLSNAVITAMLNQPRPAALASTPPAPAPNPEPAAASAPAPAPDNSSPAAATATSTATVAPTVTYVETPPATTYYQPYYYAYGYPYYYPAYGFYPGVSVSFGWGGGWHGGGWHGGGGFHGGHR